MQDRMSGVRAVARVVIQNQAGEILLCRSRNGKAWVPPGGTLDPGEDLVMAAAREAVEEAGLAAQVGAMLYLQEFRPAGRQEHVIEVAFAATPETEEPTPAVVGERLLTPIGPAERPWQAWLIQDVDGPRRECRWFSAAELKELQEPVYPAFIREQFWQGKMGVHLGLVHG